MPRFEVYRAKDGHRWRLIAANNRILATGEGHGSPRDVRRAIKTTTEAVERIANRALIDRIKAGKGDGAPN